MVDALFFISQRPIVIALAIFGAALVTAGSLAARSRQQGGRAPSSIRRQDPLSRGLTILGYAVTLTSIVLFIIAGFVSDLRP